MRSFVRFAGVLTGTTVWFRSGYNTMNFEEEACQAVWWGMVRQLPAGFQVTGCWSLRRCSGTSGRGAEHQKGMIALEWCSCTRYACEKGHVTLAADGCLEGLGRRVNAPERGGLTRGWCVPGALRARRPIWGWQGRASG